MNADLYKEDGKMEDSDEHYSIGEYDITASPNDFNIKSLFNFIESKNLVIPGFQRNYVWDIGKASRLIESILLGLPIPQIFLYEESINKFWVIDGQQRLMSIYYFINKRFPRKDKRGALRRIFAEYGHIPEEVMGDDSYFRKFNLWLPGHVSGQKNRLSGINYSTLDELRLSFDMRTVRNVIIKQNSPKGNNSVFEIFNRLNSGGIKLRHQEIRSCLYHSAFYDMLSEINNDRRWRKLLNSPDVDNHMEDIEILLRSYAMLIEGEGYKSSMVKFLNNFSSASKDYSPDKIEYLKRLFKSFLDSTECLPDKFFLRKRGKFATLFFESIFTAVCKRPFSENTLVVGKIDHARMEKLSKDDVFNNASRIRTSNSSNVRARLDRAIAILVD